MLLHHRILNSLLYQPPSIHLSIPPSFPQKNTPSKVDLASVKQLTSIPHPTLLIFSSSSMSYPSHTPSSHIFKTKKKKTPSQSRREIHTLPLAHTHTPQPPFFKTKRGKEKTFLRTILILLPVLGKIQNIQKADVLVPYVRPYL